MNKEENQSIKLETPKVIVLLIDDQQIVIEAIQRMLHEEKDIIVYSCTDPSQALELALKYNPTIVLIDLIMPNVDGLTLVGKFRSNAITQDIPIVVLSRKDDPMIKAGAFSVGANDYLVKPPNKQELLARIRYHSRGYLSLVQRNEAYQKMVESQKRLSKELGEAIKYVRSLLPPPEDSEVKSSWIYIPSLELGGTAFGYHWIDSEHFAMYNLDVFGSGIGAVFLAISVLGVLRSQSLVKTDFRKPGHVLEALNDQFQKENYDGMFFSIWYGVYDKRSRQLSYATGGGPAAVLVTGKNYDHIKSLKTSDVSIGMVPGAEFQTEVCDVDNYNKLYLFSSILYELKKADGSVLGFNEFSKILTESCPKTQRDVDFILERLKDIQKGQVFEDDFVLSKFVFRV